MSTEIDEQSLGLLRRLRGAAIDWIAGVRYPGVSGYSEVRLGDASGNTLSVTLRVEDVDDELEVCVPVVRLGKPFEAATSVDRFEIRGFRVAGVFKLQRRESIEWSVTESEGYTGSDPREHTLAEIDSGDSPNASLVDAGVAFDCGNGVTLELYADSFPLVLQLRLVVAGSPVPRPRRVLLT